MIERLYTTHDEKKLRMFGDALANSGNGELSGEKEEFVRVLRDLSITDLRTLNNEMLKGWFPHIRSIAY